jgi:ABC-type amino acid transport substrate-binding protein
VRDDDKRFDAEPSLLNDAGYVFSSIDGTTLDTVTKTHFPKAKIKSAPLGADTTQPILDVISGKADAVVYDENNSITYNKKNPDKKIRRLPSSRPLQIYRESFAVAMGEWDLRDMLNTAITELHSNGTIEKILMQYQDYGPVLLPRDPFGPENMQN